MNPTIKALQRLLERKGNLGIYDFGYCQAAYDDYLLEKAALRTLIGPDALFAPLLKEIKLYEEMNDNSALSETVREDARSRYHLLCDIKHKLADTHINELTRRIEDG